MSEVHMGRDTRLGRDVAVKVLRADLARDPQFQVRFRREAQNAAALNHPAIVAVYDTGETNGEIGTLPYIVMEYVDGQTLREIVKADGLIPQRRVLEVMADVCAALDFSHRHGIIHRDVKPANVMITRGGAVKVMDFGIARALADVANVTQTAAVIGTAQYLSPEQARGEAVDARSDVYAAGCVLFELLTGEPPFTGDSPVAVAYQHVREDPRLPSQVKADVPPELDAVVLKAISKNPANRYQSAAEMRNDLIRVLGGQRPLAPSVMSEEERTHLIASGVGAGPTRRIGPARHQVPPGGWDGPDDGDRRRTIKLILIGLVVAAAIGLIAFVAAQLFGAGGPGEVKMPSVVGQQAEQARLQVQQAGLKPDLRDEESRPDQVGLVVRTEPVADTTVARDSKVTIFRGSGPKEAKVPSLAGKTLPEADAALKAVGLKLGSSQPKPTTNDNEVNKVLGQDPAKDNVVAGGSAVNVELGTKLEGVPVPDVRGMTADEANAALRALGLNPSFRATDNAAPRNTVVGTDPAAGTIVPKDAAVTILYSNNSQFAMPDLRNMTPTQARAALRDAGFRGQVIETQQPVTDPQLDGKVVNQSPGPGQGTADTPVTIVVGRAGG
jgi:serine/threonine-protein kinase